jgi:hypothetical protein
MLEMNELPTAEWVAVSTQESGVTVFAETVFGQCSEAAMKAPQQKVSFESGE